jgi:CHAT domain-containing protein
MVLRKETRTAALPDSLLALLADPVFTADDIRIKNLQGKEPKPSTEVPSTTEKSDREADLLRSNDGLITRESSLQRIALNRLPFTRQEADEISLLLPPTQTFKALDFGANRSFLVNPKLSQYRFLHIATHGLLNTEHPELSALALSFFNDKGERQDGFFRAMEVYNLKLNAELVVLSACETGLGKEIQGEGLIGLTRGFMYAGAPRVIVSLWSVSDAATSQLMVAMYKAMLKQGKRPAAALRDAQLMMIRNRRFRAPYYWAAFQQQGEYR